MASLTAAVRVTRNFEANLSRIAEYWAVRETPQCYEHLLEELQSIVLPNLQRHPLIGRRFLARIGDSVESRRRIGALRDRFGPVEIREYLSGNYLLLYCLVAEPAGSDPGATVYLISIRHHRELSFEFNGFWRANPEEDGS
jgi:plasmid stabilization system protein ParE